MVCLGATLLAAAAIAGHLDVDSLVKEHEDHLRKIHSLRCKIDERISLDGGKSWTLLTTWKVAKSGLKERVHSKAFWVLEAGEKLERVRGSHADVLLDTEGTFTMANYDNEHPPKEPVTMLKEIVTRKRISGMIRPPRAAGVYGYKGPFAIDYILLFLPDVRYSLRDLVEKSKEKAATTERAGPNGETLYELSTKTPDGKFAYVITLSPRHGYSVVEKKGTTVAAGATGVTKVSEFLEPEPGVFLPRTYQYRTRSSPRVIREVSLRDVDVNVSIPDEELAFRFPEGIAVTDVEKNVHYIWGKGTPAQTFHSYDDLNRWRSEQRVQAMSVLRSQDPGRRLEFVVGLGIVSSVLVALVVWRRRSSATGAATP